MLPAAYTIPAAVVLVIGGGLSCFMGHRLFRLVLGLYGFYLGAMITTTSMGASSTWTLVLSAVVGGLVGALLMYAAYFLGVGLVGAGLAALVIDAGWQMLRGTDPPTVVLVLGCVLGALAALSVVRWVIIFGTAIAGAWTLIIGALALFGSQAATRAVTADDIWVLYPLNPIPDKAWVTGLWFVLSLAGILVQAATTGRTKAPAAKVVRRRTA
jgi:hypothetical protein